MELSEERIQEEVSIRLGTDAEQVLRRWLPAAITEVKSSSEELASRRRLCLLRLHLDTELGLDEKRELLNEVQEIEKAAAKLSDTLEAFENARRGVMPPVPPVQFHRSMD